MIRWIRRIVGSALLAWSAWTLFVPWLRSVSAGPPVAGPPVDPLYGVRMAPLTRAETEAAMALERELGEAPLTAVRTL